MRLLDPSSHGNFWEDAVSPTNSAVFRVRQTLSRIASAVVDDNAPAGPADSSAGLSWSSVQDVAVVAAEHAEDVDAQGRFPIESITALRANRLLSCSVPADAGGLGLSLAEMGRIARTLGSRCSSTAGIFAMHHGQLATVARHGVSDRLRDLVADCVANELLIASSTTEAATGGDPLTSRCAVQRDGDEFTLYKEAPVISYAEHADAILVTTRPDEDAPPHQQVLVVCRKAGLQLEQTSNWDALGMRGTCSPGYRLTAHGHVDDILLDDYSQMSAGTTVPVTHVLWASVWLGIADAAVARAKLVVRRAARKDPGIVTLAALRLAELLLQHQQCAAMVNQAAAEYDRHEGNWEQLSSMGFSLMMNNLKIAASNAVTAIVVGALQICGIAGYLNNGNLSLGRQIRDALSASVMVNNDRYLATNAEIAWMPLG